MNNKKGFTLVELLAVIVILGVLTAIAVPSVLGISKKIKTDMYESKKKTVEVALELWADDNKSSCIKNIDSLKIKNLIEDNYLKADDKNNSSFTNPTNGQNLYEDDVKGVLGDNNLTSYCKVTKSSIIDSLLTSSRVGYRSSIKRVQENKYTWQQNDFNRTYNTNIKVGVSVGSAKITKIETSGNSENSVYVNNNILVLNNYSSVNDANRKNYITITFSDGATQTIIIEVYASTESYN